MTAVGTYHATWPILDHVETPVADLKATALEDLVVMLHEAGLVPLARPTLAVAADRHHIVADVPVRHRAGMPA